MYLFSLLTEHRGPLVSTTLSVRMIKKKKKEWAAERNSLTVQWLGLHTSTAGGMGSIPCRGTKIPHAAQKRMGY